MEDREVGHIRQAAALLRNAESKIRVLRTIGWSPSVKRRFFEQKAGSLPRVEYPVIDPVPVLEGVQAARQHFGDDSPIDKWLGRTADAIGTTARMLSATGTPEFLEHSGQLYGLPSTRVAGISPLQLAKTFDSLCAELAGLDLGAPNPACHLATTVAAAMRKACRDMFREEAPEVVIVDQLSANALAGVRRIQIRKDACFTDRDVDQLIQHEAFVHVCTSINGKYQTDLPILASSHAGTTRTQEGLAVFAEFISGSLDPDRLRRLADRVIAIQMSIDGANFLEVFRFYKDRDLEDDQAFENTRRVFRGGVLEGGAPFTKDSVYLDGFLRVTNCLRAVVAAGRADCLDLLFCGKLDVHDMPALAQLAAMGLCRPPRFLPPWVNDRRFLVTYLTYSSFLSRIRWKEHHENYATMLANAPRLKGFGNPAH